MYEMTGIERMTNILKHKPVDRIAFFEAFWRDAQSKWVEEGFLKNGENLAEHFGLDLELAQPFNMVADIDFVPQTVEETEETILLRDGNGALLRWRKLHDGAPEHVDFKVKAREHWEENIKPLLKPDRRRIDFEGYRRDKKSAAEGNRFFAWSGINVFEAMHPVCGHEYLLMGMALDPDWVRDMVDTYSQFIIDLQEILFEEEGYPDGIWYYEDMGFKEKPFFSPTMYKEIIQPGHKRTFDFAHSHNLPVIVHCCGMVESLVPGMIESGMNCLQAIEVKAGMDLLRLYKNYGDVLSFMGGMDVRVLNTNDTKQIDKELEAKIPIVKGKYGYILHSDHSIPYSVDYTTYKYFMEKGLELGAYK